MLIKIADWMHMLPQTFIYWKWMEKGHPEKPFERYADDIVVHCKAESQANYMKRMIRNRMLSCKLTLHPEKTKVVNLRGRAEKKYPIFWVLR